MELDILRRLCFIHKSHWVRGAKVGGFEEHVSTYSSSDCNCAAVMLKKFWPKKVAIAFS